MNTFARRVLGWPTAAAMAVSLWGCTAGPAPDQVTRPAVTGCRATVPGDVNGDGYADLAVGAPGADDRQGSVHLFYGDSSGIVTIPTATAPNDIEITQDSPDVPEAAEPDDEFGSSTRLGDVNGDDCADLIVGSRGEDRIGSVTVLYGSPTGLRTAGSQQVTAASLYGAVPPSADADGAQPSAGFGTRIVVADFDGDGLDDIASTWDPGTGADSLGILYGARDGMNRGRRAVSWTADRFGAGRGATDSVAQFSAGDFDGDGRVELALAQSADVATFHVETAELVRDRSLPDVLPGRSGRTNGPMVTGDVTGDGRDDLVLADPDAGVVVLLPGSDRGLTATGRQRWRTDSAGVEDRGPGFGTSLAIGHLDGDRYADVAIGTVAESDSSSTPAGAVTLLRGARTGLSTAGYGGTSFVQSTPGIVGTDESGDGFGESLTIGQLAGQGPGVLVVGTSHETVGTLAAAGAITQLGPSASGPQPRQSQTLTLDSPGVSGAAAAGAEFGTALSTAR